MYNSGKAQIMTYITGGLHFPEHENDCMEAQVVKYFHECASNVMFRALGSILFNVIIVLLAKQCIGKSSDCQASSDGFKSYSRSKIFSHARFITKDIIFYMWVVQYGAILPLWMNCA